MAAYAFVNGNLTKEPTVNEYNGRKVARFSLAVTTTKKDEAGKYVSNFYDVSVWGQQADYVMNHFQKGTMINAIGEVTLQEYTGNDGVARKTLALNAMNVQGLSRMKGYGDQQNASAPAAPQAQQPAPAAAPKQSDLPF